MMKYRASALDGMFAADWFHSIFDYLFKSSCCFALNIWQWTTVSLRQRTMFLPSFPIWSCVIVLTILTVNSLPQDENSLFDSIASNTDSPDCNPGPINPRIRKKDTMDSSDDSMSQDVPDDSMKPNVYLGLKINSHFSSFLLIIDSAKRRAMSIQSTKQHRKIRIPKRTVPHLQPMNFYLGRTKWIQDQFSITTRVPTAKNWPVVFIMRAHKTVFFAPQSQATLVDHPNILDGFAVGEVVTLTCHLEIETSPTRTHVKTDLGQETSPGQVHHPTREKEVNGQTDLGYITQNPRIQTGISVLLARRHHSRVCEHWIEQKKMEFENVSWKIATPILYMKTVPVITKHSLK